MSLSAPGPLLTGGPHARLSMQGCLPAAPVVTYGEREVGGRSAGLSAGIVCEAVGVRAAVRGEGRNLRVTPYPLAWSMCRSSMARKKHAVGSLWRVVCGDKDM